MKVDDNDSIDRFIEKPKKALLKNWKSEVSKANKRKGKVYLASMGIYIFSKAAINKLFADHEKAVDFGKEIIPNAITKGYTVSSYQYDGYWTDIGSIPSYFEANLELASNLPAFNLFDNQKVIHTRPRMLPPSKVFGTKLMKAVIAEGCIIHAKSISNSVVGIRSRIGKKTIVKNSIIFGNDAFQSLEDILNPDVPNRGIGEGCHIENAIIDKDCFIGNNVVIKGSPRLRDKRTATHCIVQGIITIRKGAVIKDGTKIGGRL